MHSRVRRELAAKIAAGTNFSRVVIQDSYDGDFNGLVPWASDTYADENGKVVRAIAFVNLRAAQQWLDMAKTHGVYLEPTPREGQQS